MQARHDEGIAVRFAPVRWSSLLLRWICGGSGSGTLLCQLLRVFLGQMTAHQASADGADNGMMMRIMPCDATDGGTFQASCCMGGADRHATHCERGHRQLQQTDFHLIPSSMMFLSAYPNA